MFPEKVIRVDDDRIFIFAHNTPWGIYCTTDIFESAKWKCLRFLNLTEHSYTQVRSPGILIKAKYLFSVLKECIVKNRYFVIIYSRSCCSNLILFSFYDEMQRMSELLFLLWWKCVVFYTADTIIIHMSRALYSSYSHVINEPWTLQLFRGIYIYSDASIFQQTKEYSSYFSSMFQF